MISRALTNPRLSKIDWFRPASFVTLYLKALTVHPEVKHLIPQTPLHPIIDYELSAYACIKTGCSNSIIRNGTGGLTLTIFLAQQILKK